jgi:hypothetical protein
MEAYFLKLTCLFLRVSLDQWRFLSRANVVWELNSRPSEERWCSYPLGHFASLTPTPSHFFFFFKDFIYLSPLWVLDSITDGCEPPCGWWELNSGPLEEHCHLSSPRLTLEIHFCTLPDTLWTQLGLGSSCYLFLHSGGWLRQDYSKFTVTPWDSFYIICLTPIHTS